MHEDWVSPGGESFEMIVVEPKIEVIGKKYITKNVNMNNPHKERLIEIKIRLKAIGHIKDLKYLKSDNKYDITFHLSNYKLQEGDYRIISANTTFFYYSYFDAAVVKMKELISNNDPLSSSYEKMLTSIEK